MVSSFLFFFALFVPFGVFETVVLSVLSLSIGTWAFIISSWNVRGEGVSKTNRLIFITQRNIKPGDARVMSKCVYKLYVAMDFSMQSVTL